MTSLRERLRARLRRFFDAELRDLATNTGLMWAATASKSVVGLAQVVLVTRILGRGAFGQLALVTAVTDVITLVLAVRVWEWVTKFLAEARAAKNGELAGAVVRLGYGASAAVNSLACVLLLAFADVIAARALDTPALAPAIRLYALTLLATWVQDTAGATLRSLGAFRFLALFGIGSSLFRFALVLVPLLLGYGLVGLVGAYVVTEVVLSAAMLLATRRALVREFGDALARGTLATLKPRAPEIRRLLGYSFGIDTVKALASQAAVLLLGVFRGADEVGLFRLAHHFIDLANRLAAGLFQAAFASLARLAAERRFADVRRVVRRSSLAVAVVLLPGCAAASLLAPWLVDMVSGPEYADAAPVLAAYVWYLVWILTFWSAPLCVSIGRPRWAFELVLASSAVRLAVMIPAVLAWGAVGAAVAEAIHGVAYVILSLAYHARATRHMRALEQAPDRPTLEASA